MSWGFFADLRVTLPSDHWEVVRGRSLADASLPATWLGLQDESLAASFLRRPQGKETIGEALEWDIYRTNAIHDVTEQRGTTRVRVCAMLDKSQLDMLFPLAALLDAARVKGAKGALRVVNDGTYDGEDGVEVTLAATKVKAKPLADASALVEELGGELFGSKTTPKKPAKKKAAKAKPIEPPPPVEPRPLPTFIGDDPEPFWPGEIAALAKTDLETIAATLGRATGWGMQNAIRATFALDPAHAYDRFATHFAFVDGPVIEDTETTVAHLVLSVLREDLGGLEHHGWYAADPRWEELAIRIVSKQHHHADSAWELLARAQSEKGVDAIVEQFSKLDSFSGFFHALVLLPPRVIAPLRKELERRKGTRDASGLASAIAALEKRA